MSGDNTEGDATVQAIADLQESMRLMREELKVLKTSGATRAGNDPPQQSGASENALNPGHSGHRSGDVQRKRGRETDYEDEEKDHEEDDDDASEDDTETFFQVSEAGNAFLETMFGKQMEALSRRKRVQKQGKPDSRWTRCPELDPVVASTLPKDTIKADNKAKRLHTFWLDAVAPIVAVVQDIEDGKVETTEIVKALQTALLFLGNASQHHAVQRRQAILQQLNPQLKSLIKDEDFVDAPPYLFGERFAALAKERLEAAAVLKKTVATSTSTKQGFQKGHPQRYAWGCGGGS